MDYLKVSPKELRNVDDKGLHEAEVDIRKQLAELRIDIYAAPAASLSKKRALKKSLARLMTVKSEKKVESNQQAQ